MSTSETISVPAGQQKETQYLSRLELKKLMSDQSKKLSINSRKVRDELSSRGHRVFSRSQIEQIISEKRHSWKVSSNTPTKVIFDSIVHKARLKQAVFQFPTRKETRYVFGEVSPFELAQSLKHKAYLSHSSAMHIHGLTDEPPEMIYINQEQTREHSRARDLLQEAIDRAFRNRVRESNEIAEFEGIRVRVVHGQLTGGLGVIEIRRSNGETLRVTNLERTLIDIAIRPIYSGGVLAVAKAYGSARENVSVEKLFETLEEMNHVYPYHQAIGFYLDKAGVYDQSDLRHLRATPMDFDFYLEHGMKNSEYSKTLRIHHPKGM